MARVVADNGTRAMGAGETLLLVIGCMVAALLVPELPFVGAPLAALALAWLTYQGRVRSAVALALVSAVAVALSSVQPLIGLIIGPMLLLCGPLTARALESRPAARVALGLGLALAVVWAGSLAADIALSGMSPARYYASQLADMTKLTGTMLAAQPADAEAVRALVRMVLELWPAYAAVAAGLTAVLSVASAAMAARWAGKEINTLPKLAELDLSVHVAWPAILGLLLLAAAGFNKTDTAWYAVVGRNLLFVGRALLLAQGLAVFAGLYQRAKIGRFGRFLGYTVLALTEMLVPLVSLTGLADLWMNIRRIPREAGAATEETQGP